jgi:hypothetical protein
VIRRGVGIAGRIRNLQARDADVRQTILAVLDRSRPSFASPSMLRKMRFLRRPTRSLRRTP